MSTAGASGSRRIERLPAGERLDLRVPFGSCVADLEKAAEVVTAALGVREVRVLRDPANASRADVTVIRRDPLVVGGTVTWPNVRAQRLNFWEPIPVDVGEDGQVVTVTLPERNLLLGRRHRHPRPHGQALAPVRDSARN